jgi:hypothetical protein
VRRSIQIIALSLALLGLIPWARAADTPKLSDYFGSYVGRADETNGGRELRDIDIVISPYQDGGFQIEWVNVTLVDGRRDVPGVKRRQSVAIFVPVKDRGYFVEAPAFNPFKLRDETQPLQGEAIRWAALDPDGLHVNAFVVLEDGRYELQTYTRTLTETGLELKFERVVDGKTERQLTGHAVRAD